MEVAAAGKRGVRARAIPIASPRERRGGRKVKRSKRVEAAAGSGWPRVLVGVVRPRPERIVVGGRSTRRGEQRERNVTLATVRIARARLERRRRRRRRSDVSRHTNEDYIILPLAVSLTPSLSDYSPSLSD